MTTEMKDLATAVVWWRNGYLLSTAVPSTPIRTCYDRNRQREHAYEISNTSRSQRKWVVDSVGEVVGIITESDLFEVLVQQFDRAAVEA